MKEFFINHCPEILTTVFLLVFLAIGFYNDFLKQSSDDLLDDKLFDQNRNDAFMKRLGIRPVIVATSREEAEKIDSFCKDIKENILYKPNALADKARKNTSSSYFKSLTDDNDSYSHMWLLINKRRFTDKFIEQARFVAKSLIFPSKIIINDLSFDFTEESLSALKENTVYNLPFDKIVYIERDRLTIVAKELEYNIIYAKQNPEETIKIELEAVISELKTFLFGEILKILSKTSSISYSNEDLSILTDFFATVFFENKNINKRVFPVMQK